MAQHSLSGVRSQRPSASTTRSALILTSSQDVPKMNHYRCENSYKTEPDDHFPATEVRNVVDDVLREGLAEMDYEPIACKRKAVELANKLRGRLKSLDCPRFKLVSFVLIGQKENATMSLASRCMWSDKFDCHVEGRFSNSSVYGVGLVYGLYAE